VKIYVIIILLLIINHTFAQNNSTVYIYKPKGSGVGQASITINGKYVARLKSGQKVTCELFSEGNYLFGLTDTGKNKNGMVKGLSIQISLGYTYYIKLYTNDNYEMLLIKENKYEGERIINDNSLFSNKMSDFFYKEDLTTPFFDNEFRSSSLNTPVENKVEKPVDSSLSLNIIQPNVIENGEVYHTKDDKTIIKGKVSNPLLVQSLTINGQVVELNSEGYFNEEVRLIKYFDNIISIVAFTNDNSFLKKDYIIHRQLQGDNDKYNGRLGKDYALIIATSEYNEHNNLVNPLFDARRIGSDLTDLFGFQVDLLKNPTQNQLYLKIKEYSKREFSDDDQLLIFLAGHGEFDNTFKEGYIVCKDSRKNDEAKSSLVSHSNLRTIINNIPCKHILLVMDVCFGGTFDPSIAHRGGDIYERTDNNTFIKRKMQYKTRVYLTSGGNEYVPDGRPGHHSPFAHNFIEALNSGGGKDGILTLSEIMSYVEKTVPEPRVGGFGDNQPGSDFLFIINE